MSQFTGAVTGPMLRSWQADPFNKNAVYFNGFDTAVCAGALTAAIGAPWISKHGKAERWLHWPHSGGCRDGNLLSKAFTPEAYPTLNPKLKPKP